MRTAISSYFAGKADLRLNDIEQIDITIKENKLAKVHTSPVVTCTYPLETQGCLPYLHLAQSSIGVFPHDNIAVCRLGNEC